MGPQPRCVSCVRRAVRCAAAASAAAAECLVLLQLSSTPPLRRRRVHRCPCQLQARENAAALELLSGVCAELDEHIEPRDRWQAAIRGVFAGALSGRSLRSLPAGPAALLLAAVTGILHPDQCRRLTPAHTPPPSNKRRLRPGPRQHRVFPLTMHCLAAPASPPLPQATSSTWAAPPPPPCTTAARCASSRRAAGWWRGPGRWTTWTRCWTACAGAWLRGADVVLSEPSVVGGRGTTWTRCRAACAGGRDARHVGRAGCTGAALYCSAGLPCVPLVPCCPAAPHPSPAAAAGTPRRSCLWTTPAATSSWVRAGRVGRAHGPGTAGRNGWAGRSALSTDASIICCLCRLPHHPPRSHIPPALPAKPSAPLRHPPRLNPPAGMLPFARELLRTGTRVILAANELPSINDITAAELDALLPQVGVHRWDGRARMGCCAGGAGAERRCEPAAERRRLVCDRDMTRPCLPCYAAPTDCTAGLRRRPGAMQGHLHPPAAGGQQRQRPASHRPVAGGSMAQSASGCVVVWRAADRFSPRVPRRRPRPAAPSLPPLHLRPTALLPARPRGVTRSVACRSAESWRRRRRAQTWWCWRAWGGRSRPTCTRASGAPRVAGRQGEHRVVAGRRIRPVYNSPVGAATRSLHRCLPTTTTPSAHLPPQLRRHQHRNDQAP